MPVAVCQSTTEEQQPPEAEQVCVHRPWQLLRRQPDVSRDLGSAMLTTTSSMSTRSWPSASATNAIHAEAAILESAVDVVFR